MPQEHAPTDSLEIVDVGQVPSIMGGYDRVSLVTRGSEVLDSLTYEVMPPTRVDELLVYYRYRQGYPDGVGGNDWLGGSIRNDLIIGGPGDDRLGGNKGEDVLIGGPGADQMGGSANGETSPDQLQLSTGDLVDLVSDKQEEIVLLEGDRIMFRRANWTIVDARVSRNEDIFITVTSDKGDEGTILLLDLALQATPPSDDLTTAAGMQAFLSRFVTHKVSFDMAFTLV